MVDYRALLDEERKDLLAKLEELGVGTGRMNYDSNFADSSQVTAERGEAEALAGKLGVCEDCSQAIDPLRLEAKPAARYCINCVSKH
jgi:RNA polymerase-binding transcription factor DksA